jgi:hypothetical protein
MFSTVRPSFKSLATIVALVAVAACSDSTAPGGGQQAAGGSYTLQTVNGADIPYTYTSGANTITIQSDTYMLNANGTYSETITESISNGSTSSPGADTESGTWAQNGTAVAFTPTQSSQNNLTAYTAALTSGTTFSHSILTFSSNGVVWVYEHD